ncbi:terminase-like family protein [Bacteriophage DSS3_MAL1]|nr:terminase-like family protein [Bacteriophage DSS3_MAL1]
MTGVLITQEERAQYRQLLSELEDYAKRFEDHLTGKAALPAEVIQMMESRLGTSDPSAILRALLDLRAHYDREYDDALRYAAQFRFSPFCEYMRREEVPALHQEFLIDHMELIHESAATKGAKGISRLAISLPPGAAKTTYASHRFAAWHLGRRPDDRWLQGAHTQTFAKDRLGKVVRNLMGEARYNAVFPEMRLSASSSAADYFEFTGGAGYYKAVGVGVGISGYRADIGAIDDPIASREDAESATLRRKLHEWYEDDFGTRPMPGSPIYVVNTRWHEDDLVGHELQKMAEGRGDHWHIINIPAISLGDADPSGKGDPLGRPEGEGLWPEVFGTEFYLAKKRAITGRSWNSLYMGNPVDEEGGVLKREDVRRYKNVPKDETRNGNVVKKVIKKVTLSVDCAEKATQRSDYTAATVWVETSDKKHYLVHASRTKKEFVEMVEWIEHMARTWNVNQILVEDRGAGTQYIQIREKSPGPAPVIGIATKQQSKEFRFDGVTPMFAAGEVLLPETGTDWIADIEAELFAFPAGKNDDYVDSVSQYLAKAREGSTNRKGVRKMRSSSYAR